MIPSLAESLMQAAAYKPMSCDEWAKFKQKPESTGSRNKEQIMALLNTHGVCRSADLFNQLKVSQETLHVTLNELIKEKRIKRISHGQYKAC